jgi:FdhE protein
MITLEQLEHSCDLIQKLRPAYQPILEFYSRVFSAQETSKADIVIAPVEIEPDLLKIKQKNGLPLIDQSEFLIDVPASERLFKQICELAIDFAPKLSVNAGVFKNASHNKALDLETLFSAILNDQGAVLHDMAGRLSVTEHELIFFGYAGMAPSIEICAEQLKAYLTDLPDREKGFCPICGNHPDMAFLDKDGKRHLKCCFCAHEWEIKRMGCVFCENNDNEMQQYFFSDQEKEYRVNLCDHCHNYIKLIDLRQIDRAFYPKLEQITTLHLDMQAREKGYTNDVSILPDT